MSRVVISGIGVVSPFGVHLIHVNELKPVSPAPGHYFVAELR